MMRKCELCDRTAKMYCESDQASLCWDCDEKVHRANFLVAKHCRTLLCHVCQSLTPWKGSGDKLGPTVSVCESCFTTAHCNRRDGGGLHRLENQSYRSHMAADDEDEDEDDTDDGTEDEEEEEDYDDDEEEIDVEDDDDDENQVVPWSGESNSPPPPPPPVSCSSSSTSGSEEEVSLKRRRDFTDFNSDDEIGCSSSGIGSRETANEEANTSSMMSSFRTSKHPRLEADDDINQADSSRSTEIINSLRRLQKQIINNGGAGDAASASAAVLAICRLSRDE